MLFVQNFKVGLMVDLLTTQPPKDYWGGGGYQKLTKLDIWNIILKKNDKTEMDYYDDCIKCFFPPRDLQFNEIEGIADDAFKSLESLIDL